MFNTLAESDGNLSVHLRALSDDCGILQHAHFRIPDRDHGYCTDDNARGLLFLLRLSQVRKLDESEERLLNACVAFLDHALDGETNRFRNFMGYDRRFCDDAFHEDAHARAVWALGEAMAMRAADPMGLWARNLFDRCVLDLPSLGGPRAWAYCALGLLAALQAEPRWTEGQDVLCALAAKLQQRWNDAAKPDWPWFEDGLAYDNARLSEAALRLGAYQHDPQLTEAGLQSLDALWKWQDEGGVFAPVGHETFGRNRREPARFDQQPLEALAMLEAALAAFDVTREAHWRTRAVAAWRWFHGENMLGLALAVPEIGLCHDGLQPDGVNANAGAESTLSYVLAEVAAVVAGLAA